MSVTDRSVCPPDPPADEAGVSDSGASTALSPDETFHILQTFRRRESIRYLLREDGPVKMRDIAEHVAAREHETTVADLTSAQRQRVYIPLYQSHLPKLDSAGVIEYDKPRGIVRPTERLESFRPYLDAATSPSVETDDGRTNPAQRRRERRYYGAAIAGSVALLLGSTADVVRVPGASLGAIVATLFVLATVACVLHRTGGPSFAALRRRGR